MRAPRMLVRYVCWRVMASCTSSEAMEIVPSLAEGDERQDQSMERVECNRASENPLVRASSASLLGLISSLQRCLPEQRRRACKPWLWFRVARGHDLPAKVRLHAVPIRFDPPVPKPEQMSDDASRMLSCRATPCSRGVGERALGNSGGLRAHREIANFQRDPCSNERSPEESRRR